MQLLEAGTHTWKAMPDTLGRRLSEGSYTAPDHVRLISWLMVLNSTGKVPRLGISLPPGSGKSEIIDYYDSIYLLEHDPRRRIILASYSGELAEEQGKRVRNTIESASDILRVRLMQDSRAADRWRTTAGGGMWTVGIGGSITGRRASNLKIDDPHKNFAEAMSEKNQIDTWNWYGSVARTRMLPRSALAVVQTRWAEGDLLGRLEQNDENRGDWLFVRLPAIAETDETIQSVLGVWYDRLIAKGVTEFPDWRRDKGAALWPFLEPGVPWFDEEEYASIRADVGEVVWAGLYQQRPSPAEGNQFKRYDWRRLDGPMPAGTYTYVRRWDLAGTEGEKSDWTAGCLMAMNHETRHLYIVDCRRARLGPTEVEHFIAMTAQEDRDNFGHVYTRIEREPGSAGVAMETHYMQQVLQGYAAEFLPSSGKKEIRSLPFSGQVGARNVYLCRRVRSNGETVIPDWWEWLIEEAAVFPNGEHDDLVDVASLAYVDLIELLPRRRRATVRSSARKQLGF
jgi:predicted phage terminase large subunit-like protein